MYKLHLIPFVATISHCIAYLRRIAINRMRRSTLVGLTSWCIPWPWPGTLLYHSSTTASTQTTETEQWATRTAAISGSNGSSGLGLLTFSWTIASTTARRDMNLVSMHFMISDL